MIYGVVYLITNNVNGKQYVGQTISDPDKYWQRRLTAAENGTFRPQLLHRAIKKYGRGAFSFVVIWQSSDKVSLDISEISFISLFETISPKGYNLRLGGSREKHSQKSKNRMREVFNSPKNRARRSAAAQEVNARPSVKARISETSIQTWKVNRQARCDAIKSALSSQATRVALGNVTRKSRWINNGISNKRLKSNANLPAGWNYGRLFSEEHKANHLAAVRSAEHRLKILEGIHRQERN